MRVGPLTVERNWEHAGTLVAWHWWWFPAFWNRKILRKKPVVKTLDTYIQEAHDRLRGELNRPLFSREAFIYIRPNTEDEQSPHP